MRVEAPPLTSTLTVTLPVPVPEGDPTIESHGSLGTALQPQPEAEAVMPTRPDPPAAPTEDDPGARLMAQALPNWVSEKVSP